MAKFHKQQNTWRYFMSFRINTNVDALNAYAALAKVNAQTTQAQLRLATGKRINSVADDTSGFTIGKSLDSKVQLMKSAQSNVASAKNMLSTAESALLNVKDLVTKIRTKVSDASNSTADRTAIAKDIQALGQEISNIFSTTKFNNTTLLSGSVANGGMSTVGSFSFQTGDAATDTLTLDFASGLASTGSTNSLFLDANLANTLSSFTGVSTGSDILSAQGIASLAGDTSVFSSKSALDFIEDKIDDSLQKIGNQTQRLDAKDDFLTVAISNATASVSRLFDADMAAEQLNATKGSILQQSATAMLSQLNSAPQQIMQLFR
jgi:flagellin